MTSGTYTVGTYITGVEPGTTASTLLSGLTCTGGTIKILNSDFTENTGTVATGNKVGVYVDGTLVDWKDIVIYGDTTGDGKINVLDAIKLNRHSIGLANMSGCYLTAADASRDGNVNILDSIVINRYTIGLASVNQK